MPQPPGVAAEAAADVLGQDRQGADAGAPGGEVEVGVGDDGLVVGRLGVGGGLAHVHLREALARILPFEKIENVRTMVWHSFFRPGSSEKC